MKKVPFPIDFGPQNANFCHFFSPGPKSKPAKVAEGLRVGVYAVSPKQIHVLAPQNPHRTTPNTILQGGAEFARFFSPENQVRIQQM